MKKSKTIIDLMKCRDELYKKRFNGKIRGFNGYYEYSIIDNYETEFDDFKSNSIQIDNVNAIVLEVENTFVLAAIQFEADKFTVQDVINWLVDYKIVFNLKESNENKVDNCEIIITGLLFRGNQLILCKKGNKTLFYKQDEFIEVTEKYIYFNEEVNTNHAKNIDLESNNKKLRIVLNGKSIEHIERLNFDLTKDLIIVNGSVMVADYIDEYCDTIGFYNSDDDLLPVSFILYEDTNVNINITTKEDGSKICIVEYGYLINQDEL